MKEEKCEETKDCMLDYLVVLLDDRKTYEHCQ